MPDLPELKPQEVLQQLKAPAGGDLQMRAAVSGVAMAARADGRWDGLAGPIAFPVERDQRFSEYTTKLANPKARVSQSTQLYHGCVPTGVFLNVGKGRKAEKCERVGSYGYVLRHVSLGQAVSWKADVVKGPAVRPNVAPGMSELMVSAGQAMTVQHQIVATESDEKSEEKKTSEGDGGICGRLKLASGGGVLAAFFLTGFIWTRRRKSKQP